MGCCSTSNNKNEKPAEFSCPTCGDEGTSVKTITPKSLLRDIALDRFDEKLDYRFCKNPECDTVYFSNSPDLLFSKNEVKVKVTVKDKSLDVNLCYCFDYTRQSILDEIKENGFSNAVKEISAKMKNPGCSCDIKNPQGGCCLKNVKACIREVS